MSAGFWLQPPDPTPSLLRLFDSVLPRLHNTPTEPRLLTGYSETLSVLLSCIASSRRGDSLLLRSYVIEEGTSSRDVIRALRGAAGRGVSLRLGLDRGLLSSFTRAVEGTDSLARDLALIALEWPNSVTLEPGSLPDHSKVVLLTSPVAHRCCAVLGGINLGDRFAHWTDFSLLLRGADTVGRLAAALNLPPTFGYGHQSHAPPYSAISFAVNTPTFVPHWQLKFATRARMEGAWGVRPELAAFYGDPSLRSFTTATAYLDGEGCELLLLALSRGADVRLIMPREANVYAHCNARALSRLMRAASVPGSGRLSVFLHGDAVEMMHAKVAVGVHKDGTMRAYLGSANLKGRSLTQFGEVVVVVEGGEVAEALAAGLEALVGQGSQLSGRRDVRLRHDPTVAACEEHCG